MPGFNFSQSESQSTSSSESQSSSFGLQGSQQNVFGGDIFRQLFGGAGQVASQLAGQTGGLTAAANQLFGTGNQFLQNLGQIGSQASQQAQIGQLGTDIGQFFNEQILPGIGRQAQAVGGLGGSRQDVAQGAAAGQALNAFQRGAVDIGARAQGQQLQAAQTGLSFLPQQFGLAQAGFGAAFSPFAQLAEILGGPTALTSSFGRQGAQASAESRSQQTSSSVGGGLTDFFF